MRAHVKVRLFSYIGFTVVNDNITYTSLYLMLHPNTESLSTAWFSRVGSLASSLMRGRCFGCQEVPSNNNCNYYLLLRLKIILSNFYIILYNTYKYTWRLIMCNIHYQIYIYINSCVSCIILWHTLLGNSATSRCKQTSPQK